MVIKQSIIAAWLSLSISFISATPVKQVLIVKKNKQMIGVTFDDVSLGSEKDAVLFQNLLETASRYPGQVMIMNESGCIDDDLKREDDESLDEVVSSYAEEEDSDVPRFSDFFDILASNEESLPAHVRFVNVEPTSQGLWSHIARAFEFIDNCIEFENAVEDGDQINTTLSEDVQSTLTALIREGEDPGLEHYFEKAYLKFLRSIRFKDIEDAAKKDWEFVEQLRQLKCPALNDYIAEAKKACLDYIGSMRQRLLKHHLTEQELAQTPLISLYFNNLMRNQDDEGEEQSEDWAEGDLAPLQSIGLEYVFSQPIEIFQPLYALRALAYLYDRNCSAQRVTVNLFEVYAEKLVKLFEMLDCRSFISHEKTGQGLPADAYNWICESKKDDEKPAEPKTSKTHPWGPFNSFDEWLKFEADSTCVVM